MTLADDFRYADVLKKDPIDRDRDGKVYDGTKRERPALPSEMMPDVRARLGGRGGGGPRKPKAPAKAGGGPAPAPKPQAKYLVRWEDQGVVRHKMFPDKEDALDFARARNRGGAKNVGAFPEGHKEFKANENLADRSRMPREDMAGGNIEDLKGMPPKGQLPNGGKKNPGGVREGERGKSPTLLEAERNKRLYGDPKGLKFTGLKDGDPALKDEKDFYGDDGQVPGVEVAERMGREGEFGEADPRWPGAQKRAWQKGFAERKNKPKANAEELAPRKANDDKNKKYNYDNLDDGAFYDHADKRLKANVADGVDPEEGDALRAEGKKRGIDIYGDKRPGDGGADNDPIKRKQAEDKRKAQREALGDVDGQGQQAGKRGAHPDENPYKPNGPKPNPEFAEAWERGRQREHNADIKRRADEKAAAADKRRRDVNRRANKLMQRDAPGDKEKNAADDAENAKKYTKDDERHYVRIQNGELEVDQVYEFQNRADAEVFARNERGDALYAETAAMDVKLYAPGNPEYDEMKGRGQRLDTRKKDANERANPDNADFKNYPEMQDHHRDQVHRLNALMLQERKDDHERQRKAYNDANAKIAEEKMKAKLGEDKPHWVVYPDGSKRRFANKKEAEAEELEFRKLMFQAANAQRGGAGRNGRFDNAMNAKVQIIADKDMADKNVEVPVERRAWKDIPKAQQYVNLKGERMVQKPEGLVPWEGDKAVAREGAGGAVGRRIGGNPDAGVARRAIIDGRGFRAIDTDGKTIEPEPKKARLRIMQNKRGAQPGGYIVQGTDYKGRKVKVHARNREIAANIKAALGHRELRDDDYRDEWENAERARRLREDKAEREAKQPHYIRYADGEVARFGNREDAERGAMRDGISPGKIISPGMPEHAKAFAEWNEQDAKRGEERNQDRKDNLGVDTSGRKVETPGRPKVEMPEGYVGFDDKGRGANNPKNPKDAPHIAMYFDDKGKHIKNFPNQREALEFMFMRNAKGEGNKDDAILGPEDRFFDMNAALGSGPLANEALVRIEEKRAADVELKRKELAAKRVLADAAMNDKAPTWDRDQPYQMDDVVEFDGDEYKALKNFAPGGASPRVKGAWERVQEDAAAPAGGGPPVPPKNPGSNTLEKWNGYANDMERAIGKGPNEIDFGNDEANGLARRWIRAVKAAANGDEDGFQKHMDEFFMLENDKGVDAPMIQDKIDDLFEAKYPEMLDQAFDMRRFWGQRDGKNSDMYNQDNMRREWKAAGGGKKSDHKALEVGANAPAIKKHFEDGGSIADAPAGDVMGYITAHPERFQKLQNGKAGVSPNWWIVDLERPADKEVIPVGKRNGDIEWKEVNHETWVAKFSLAAEDHQQDVRQDFRGRGIQHDILAEVVAQNIQDQLGIYSAPARLGSPGGSKNPVVLQKHLSHATTDSKDKDESFGIQFMHPSAFMDRKGRGTEGWAPGSSWLDNMEDPGQLLEMAFFDYLIVNSDRHPGNWSGLLRRDGKIRVGVYDNGLGFRHSGQQAADALSYDRNIGYGAQAMKDPQAIADWVNKFVDERMEKFDRQKMLDRLIASGASQEEIDIGMKWIDGVQKRMGMLKDDKDQIIKDLQRRARR